MRFNIAAVVGRLGDLWRQAHEFLTFIQTEAARFTREDWERERARLEESEPDWSQYLTFLSEPSDETGPIDTVIAIWRDRE